MSRYKPKGWRNEPHRHYLAAKGIKTKNRYFQSKAAELFGNIARANVSGSQEDIERRNRLLGEESRGAAETREAALTQPVREPKLTAEEEANVQEPLRETGVKGISINQGYKFWRSDKEGIKALQALKQQGREVANQIQEIDKRIANAKRGLGANTSRQRTQEINELVKRLDEQHTRLSRELIEDIGKRAELTARAIKVQQAQGMAGLRKEFSPRQRQVLARQVDKFRRGVNIVE